MPDDIIAVDSPRAPVTGARPYWIPDVKGWLAFAVVVLVGFMLTMLMLRPLAIDERVSNLLSMLIGLLVGCFKDVFSYYFSSTQGSQDKDKTIAQQSASLAVSQPVMVTPMREI